MKKLRKDKILRELKKGEMYRIFTVHFQIFSSGCDEHYDFSVDQMDDAVGKLHDLSLTHNIEYFFHWDDFIEESMPNNTLQVYFRPSEDFKTNISADVVQAFIDLMNKQMEQMKKMKSENEKIISEFFSEHPEFSSGKQ